MRAPAGASSFRGALHALTALALLILPLLPDLATPARAEVPLNVEVGASGNPEETGIAINPVAPDNIVGCAQVPPRWYASFDGGAGWAEGVITDPSALGDPAVVFGPEGTVYYSYIGRFETSGIFVNRSSDGGLTWLPEGVAVVAHAGSVPFEDKCYPSCDFTDGPTRGNVYIGWTRFDAYNSSNPADSTQILFARSTNGGVSFSSPLRISDQGGTAEDSDLAVQGAVPAPGPGGTVAVAWSGPRGIEFDRSNDGGITFGADRVIADQPGGWDFDVPGIYRCNGLPITKTDVSAGPHRGRIYVCWSDQRYGDTDVFLIRSSDDGFSWSAPLRVNNDPVGDGADQFFPWMDVDPLTGTVVIVFYDRREYPGSLLTDVYLAVSVDGGESFTNERISATPFLPDAGVFFGDYIGIASYGGRVRPLWMRMDNRVLTIWTALIETAPSGLGPLADASAGDGPRLRVEPNPVRASARFLLLSGENGARIAPPLPLLILDARGRVVRRLSAEIGGPIWDGRDDRGRAVPAGSYYARAGNGASARVVVLRR